MYSHTAIQRWPTEKFLLAIVMLISIPVWALLIVSVAGAVYVALVGLFVLFAHAASIAYIRGNAVKVNSEQFPELNSAVINLCKQFDIKKIPDVYLMQSNGVLNALATKFVRSKMLVIYSNLLEACENDNAARDMILGHELGHIKSGHLNWGWLLFPGMLFPFLGKAYSRAREYTCDRYGLAATGNNKTGALRGLTILSVGKLYAPQVSHKAMANQLHHLNTAWMRIGEWMSSHPPLVKRICALDSSLKDGIKVSCWGTLKGLSIVTFILSLLVGGMVFLVLVESKHIEQRKAALAAANQSATDNTDMATANRSMTDILTSTNNSSLPQE